MTDPAVQRERLVDRLERQGRIERETTREALLRVPRHEFVPERRQESAYADRPLPIGEDQTISAPHMVAMMTDLLGLELGDRVLEIGTGCGYHAAVTAAVVGARNDDTEPRDDDTEGGDDVGEVYSVEFHEPLAAAARERLDRLGYPVHVRVGDGHAGWPEGAPYDAAYLTCAAADLPERVVEQVEPGGRIVAPIGQGRQTLVRATKRADGGLDRERHGGVRFVPMQSE
ncbi:protein-L-isoaspartate(D-aspartate) O-methyltransferase [Halococcus saccharolyticus]|uniref:Protein-L-isoaspartate O-methyltransferase n=1 Tax=Halococcus saccharolyticus DSM 5350 TaxID=1227455 RepID=M0MG37_9EURY|nr:protein-L-isoaspartate(D-aspartate) O-methyltransferase [Halococcus saccharolyticus]EMA43385.1 protein-L-isoaspartate O-methyltransferase [Halococcus saccharolyticus DSM 5350]